jgi:hypothetical protein
VAPNHAASWFYFEDFKSIACAWFYPDYTVIFFFFLKKNNNFSCGMILVVVTGLL